LIVRADLLSGFTHSPPQRKQSDLGVQKQGPVFEEKLSRESPFLKQLRVGIAIQDTGLSPENGKRLREIKVWEKKRRRGSSEIIEKRGQSVKLPLRNLLTPKPSRKMTGEGA